jgi:hypothetical protein
MTEELTEQGEVGVGEGAATSPGAPGARGVAEQPTAEAPQPATAGGPEAAPERPVDLTQMEEFRKWQAARDRRETQLQQQLQEQARQMAEMQREFEQARLASADPEEAAAYYQQQAQQLREEQVRQAAQASERERIIGRVYQKLEQMGLDANTPGLEWPEEISWQGAADVLASAGRIKALQAETLAKDTKTAADQAAQAAAAQALSEAGVTKVSTATGQAASRDLRAEFEAEKAKLTHSGDVVAYARLKSKYRKLGLDL